MFYKVIFQASDNISFRYQAIFIGRNGGRTKTYFGDRNIRHYTMYGADKDDYTFPSDLSNPFNRNTLEALILWTNPSINQAIKDYKAKYNFI